MFNNLDNDPRLKGVSGGDNNITKIKKVFLQVVKKMIIVRLDNNCKTTYYDKNKKQLIYDGAI